jgi:hypothetical protein
LTVTIFVVGKIPALDVFVRVGRTLKNAEGLLMKTKSSRRMRVLTGNEVAAVAGGLLGEIPGYKVQLPDGLFVSGYSCFGSTFDGQFTGATCHNTY